MTIDRRTLLTALAPLTAGCSSQVSEKNTTSQQATTVVNTGPPHFEDVELSGPSEIVVGEQFYLTVGVTNTGGRAGDFTTTMTADTGENAKNIGIEIADIGSGERKEKRFGPYHSDYAGNYQIRITDYALTHSVEFTPITASVGQTASLPNGIDLTINGVDFEAGFFYKTGPDTRKQLLASRDNIYAVLDVSAKNTSSEARRVPELTPESGESVTTISGYGTDLNSIENIRSPIHGRDILAGREISGSLLFKYPYPAAREQLEYTWDSNLAPPEARLKVPPEEGKKRPLPKFSLNSLTLPDSAYSGTEVSVQAEISNTGQQKATFRGELQSRPNTKTSFESVSVASTEIPVGSSATVELPTWKKSAGDQHIRLAPFSDTAKIRYIKPELAIGETYTTPWSSITLHKIADPNVSEYDFTVDGTQDTEYALFDRKVIFTYFTAKNTAATSMHFPWFSDFSLTVDGRGYKGNSPYAEGRPKLIDPFEGWFWRHGSSLPPGETYSGWVTFQVPESLNIRDSNIEVAIPTPDHGEFSVSWSTTK